MDLKAFVTTVQPLLESNVVGAVVSSLLGAFLGLWVYTRQAQERIAAAISWAWGSPHYGEDELPFLVVQNLGNIPAYLTSARYLRGHFIRRRLAQAEAITYYEIEDDSWPKVVAAASHGTFMMSQEQMLKLIESAGPLNRFLHRWVRNYLWVEIRTVAGKRMVISAREGICLRDRPGWW